MSKEFLAFLDTFQALMVQQGKAMSQHNEIVKVMHRITKGLGVIGATPSGGSAKVAKLLCRERDEDEDSAIVVTPSWGMFGNPTPWIKQKTNPLHLDFPQGAHMGLVDVSKVEDTQPPWILHMGRIQVAIKSFILHHLGFKDGIEFLEFAKKDRASSLTHYVQDFNRMLTMVLLKKEFARKLVFLHGLKPWVQKIVH